MPREPDLRFDIDALFAHLRNNLDRDPETEDSEWHFTFRSDDLDQLARIAESLSDEFDVHLQEEVETIEDGREFIGPPLLAVVILGAMPAEEVKTLADRFANLARRESITYEGVSSFEPLDLEEAFGWLDLEAACWRLRHFTDTGLALGEPVPFVFAIEVSDAAKAERAAAGARAAGFPDVEIAEDDDGEPAGIIVRIAGKNDEKLLAAHYRKMEKLAAGVGGELLGAQFFDDESEGADTDSPEHDEG